MSYAHVTSDAPQAWYRQFWPWFLIALPASTVVACMFTIWLAISNPEEVLRAPAQAETALRPYGEVRSAYPEAAAEDAEAAAESVATPAS